MLSPPRPSDNDGVQTALDLSPFSDGDEEGQDRVDEASRCGWDATNDGGVEGQGCGVRRRRQKAEGLKTIDAALGFLF
ncbi:hypothetical protein GOBAR_AA37837 [Gossypium barbadense]|uniref:Uncharacterized protein n=1 Tax=Gossypium barbadense TaxID=3634 RepID=A0A2P5VVL3_GOSBA|nr:hypothetical protein GOBAR_AA37837 [Gossypium barbadense]